MEGRFGFVSKTSRLCGCFLALLFSFEGFSFAKMLISLVEQFGSRIKEAHSLGRWHFDEVGVRSFKVVDKCGSLCKWSCWQVLVASGGWVK
jgi:hypothetical protein